MNILFYSKEEHRLDWLNQFNHVSKEQSTVCGIQIMLCGVELQEVSNSDGSQVVAVTRKQEARAVTETITVKSSPVTVEQQVDITQLSAAPNSSRLHTSIVIS